MKYKTFKNIINTGVIYCNYLEENKDYTIIELLENGDYYAKDYINDRTEYLRLERCFNRDVEAGVFPYFSFSANMDKGHRLYRYHNVD